MTKNLTVVLDNRPGTLASVCDAIGHAGVNIEGMCCFASQGVAILYAAVEDAAAARRAIERIGFRVGEEREVVVVPVQDRPGGAATVLRRIGDAGINIELVYQATGNRLVIGLRDPELLRSIL